VNTPPATPAALPVLALALACAPPLGAQDFQPPKPGPEHERLLALAGRWQLAIEGQDAKGTAEFKPILGGRFLTEDVKLPLGDFSFEWHGIYGYDTHKKKYTAAWVDNMDTSIETAEGDPDPSGKLFRLRGEHENPQTGQPARFIWQMTLKSADQIEVEMFEVDAAGAETSVMVIQGARVK
jgi:hypothetical protein